MQDLYTGKPGSVVVKLPRLVLVVLLAAAAPAQQLTDWDLLRLVAESERQAIERARKRDIDYRRRLLAERFNTLLEALSQFSEAYNRGQGNVWPASRARAVRKAWADLEKCEGFRK